MEYGADKKSTLARRSFTWKGGVGGSRPWLPSGDKKKGCHGREAILGVRASDAMRFEAHFGAI